MGAICGVVHKRWAAFFIIRLDDSIHNSAAFPEDAVGISVCNRGEAAVGVYCRQLLLYGIMENDSSCDVVSASRILFFYLWLTFLYRL